MKIMRGATRIVFVFNKSVLKIPNVKEYKLFLNGILANLQEKTFSKMNREDLARVKFCDPLGLFLIMEKAKVFSEDELSDLDCDKFANDLNERYKDDDMKEFMTSDAKPSNWGYINDRFVKIDYGN